MRHLIDPTDLTVAETEQIVALAEDIIANRAKYSEACRGKKLATLFYEPSTRTRLSFTAAMLELGGQVIGFSDANSSSVSKGETVADTVRVIRCFADIIAMRHFKEGAPLVASQYAGIPVINAGDGSHAHPTQTLTDLLTIKREKGRFDNMTIGFCGDLKFGRTVHSLIKALSRYSNIKVILIAPQELRLPDYMLAEMAENSRLEFREVETMEEVMPELDILYMTRVQKERFLDEEEFNRVKDSFVLDPSKLRTAKPDMIVLHPLPRVNEITRAVDNDPRAAYFRQVENGKFVRMALGGVHDESEIRGHRRTYIGSMPGKIIQSLVKAGVRNPLFLLDEIDKLGSDFRGDPAAALLEVLDPEQNKTFQDHYVDVDFDLSDVMFVATSNSYEIPPALLDRMEVIHLDGYTEDEKYHIAAEHLIPKQMQLNGVEKNEVSITEGAIRDIVRYYTREAGVRALERAVGKIFRKIVRRNDAGKSEVKEPVVVTEKNLADYLGVRRFTFGTAQKEPQIGQVNGLAWTEVGGDILTVEAVVFPGKGVVQRTGSLGDVMKESVEAADGPSAGAAITTAIVSAMTNNPVRPDVAMTGEITLRGEVLEIGGLKEKLLAALRGGIKKVLIPQSNLKDLAEIPENVKAGLEIVPVRWIDQVLAQALVLPLHPLEKKEDAKPQTLVVPTGVPMPKSGAVTR